jgi:hypothetical protein
MTRRSRLVRAALWCLAIAYGAVAAELYLRLAFPEPLLPRYVTAAPYGVRMNVPNRDFWQETTEVRAEFRINARGQRGDEVVPYERPPGRCRALMLGDSYFMGYEVDIRDSFQEEVARRLRARGHDCEVVNMAVSGFGTAESLVALEGEGMRYRPDLVLLQWHRTDPEDNLRSGLFRVEDGRLARARDRYLPGVGVSDALVGNPVYRWLSERSHLYNATRERIAGSAKDLLASLGALRLAAAASAAETEAEGAAARARAADELNVLLLRRVREVAESQGARLVLVDIPVQHGRTRFSSSLDLLPRGWDDGFVVASPMPLFEAASAPEVKLYREHGHRHLTPLGNALLAESVVRALDGAGLLERLAPATRGAALPGEGPAEAAYLPVRAGAAR